MMKMYIPKADIWPYFMQHKTAFLRDDMHLAAESADGSLAIYITMENGFPDFVVERNEVFEREKIVTSNSKADTEVVYGELLAAYDGEFADGGVSLSDEDEDRLDELTTAALDFLLAVVEDQDALNDIDVDLFLSNMEEYLFETEGIPVRHPMVEDGKVIQYPFCAD